MGNVTRIGVTFRMGRRIHFSSGLIDEAKLKAGQSFAVEIVNTTKPYLRLVSSERQNTKVYYIVLAQTSGGCTKRGNTLVGITDRNLLAQLGVPEVTKNVAARWHKNGDQTVIEFTFPRKEIAA